MKLFTLICSLLIVLGGLFALNAVVFMKSAEIERDRNICRIYTENGIPDYIITRGIKYDLDKYGNPKVGIQGVNPWVYDEVVNKRGCITINTEK